MQTFTLPVLTLCAYITTQVSCEGIFSTEVESCDTEDDVRQNYRDALYEFTTQVFRNTSVDTYNHFVFSPLTLWIILAGIAEAADHLSKQKIFHVLNLPYEPCLRLKYYQLATSRFTTSEDIVINTKRALVIDNDVTMNPSYHEFLFQKSLIEVVSASLHDNPQEALKEIRRVTSARLSNLDLSGNSVILDIIDYNGLWSTAFEDAVEEKANFFSQTGAIVGTVDLMRVKKRARVAYIQSINTKALELPIGYNDRYRMVFGLMLDRNISKALNGIRSSIIEEYLSNVQESYKPIDIAIPRINITSEYDVREILEEYGIKDLWVDPVITRQISTPAMLPSGFVQRATITMDNGGLEAAPPNAQPSNNVSTGLDPILGPDFIANRPFLFGLFDTETYTCILAAIFRQPTVSGIVLIE